VRRILRRIVHNWPLKVAAVALASILYGGLAVSQNTQTFLGVVPVRVENKPPNTVLLSIPEPVTSITYYAPPDVHVATSSFRATVDLTGVDPNGLVTSVPIQVDSPDTRVQVLDFTPKFATIQLDRLITNSVPVKVEHGAVPTGLELGTTAVDPPTVTISGAASLVDQVVWAQANVQIDPEGIDVDQEVDLVPINGNGDAVRPLDVNPSTARVTIPVFTNKQSRTLPVNPVLTGTPAAGFEIASVTVKPQTALVQGDAEQLDALVKLDTKAIPMTGVSADQTVTVGLDLPTGVVPVGDDTVVVTIKLRPITETRTFSAGIRLVGAKPNLTYDVAVDSVLLTVGGSSADLDRMSGATLVVDVDVSTLTTGTADIPVTAVLPAGTTLVAASPEKVQVTVTGPASAPPASPAVVEPSASPVAGG
jgi:YbbR domain-containing protein